MFTNSAAEARVSILAEAVRCGSVASDSDTQSAPISLFSVSMATISVSIPQ